MSKKTWKVISLVWGIIQDKPRLIKWLSVRFFSAFLPLLSIYLFARTIKLIELKSNFATVFFLILLILIIRLLDNFLRIKSTFKLEDCISDIGFDVHNYFINGLKPENRDERHESIQAVRNFADATCLTLKLFKQPGVDSLVSLISIPLILIFLDFQVFILTTAYILIYVVIDYYTTQHYMHFKDIQNTKTEVYYAKLVDSNDVDLEQKSFTRHFSRLTHWNFTEWFILQNTAVFFYSLILGYLVIAVVSGTKHISDLVLVMGYVASVQSYLNSFSEIKDSIADTAVAVDHLAKNKCVSIIDLDDLV